MPKPAAPVNKGLACARARWIPASAIFAATAAIAIAGATAASASTAVLRTASSPLGTIVVNSSGHAVYEFAADSKGHSTCSGECLTYWPPVAAPSTIPASIPGVTGKVGFIKRTDGKRQLTLNGMPLYTFTGDTKAGQTNGQGSSGSGAKWWVVSPAGKPITAQASSGTSGGSSAPPSGGGGTGGDIYNY